MSEYINPNPTNKNESLSDEDILANPNNGDNFTPESIETPEDLDGQQLLSANILKLIESGEKNALSDYFTDALSNNIESISQQERSAIIELLIERQRTNICEDLSEKHNIVISELESQIKQGHAKLSERGSELSRFNRRMENEILDSVTSKYRDSGNITLAVRGYDDVLPIVRNEKNEAENYRSSWNGLLRSQKSTIEEYSHDFKNSPDREHLDALDSASNIDFNNPESSQKDLSGLIKPEIISIAVSEIKDILINAKSNNQNPEESILEYLKIGVQSGAEESIDSINSFISKFEELMGDNRVNKDISELLEACYSVESFTSRALEPRIDEDLALSLHRRQTQAANDLSYKIKSVSSSMNDFSIKELRILNFKAETKPEVSQYASLFR